jgi:hypothetical protein
MCRGRRREHGGEVRSVHHFLKGTIMNTSTRRAIVTAAVILIAATGTAPAVARPDPGGPRTDSPSAYDSLHCPLTRVGTQFARCDHLTGAGVPAPPWVPES